ncbi:MAG: peptidoglycan DD-metalloendopeptidase family protein [Clostridiales bacterium]|jgi:murein DD-endopeptidase MepM/ murein hydrolase activator NlpD|nr:peptidoglycan DD-metalloendopeptidase family protein [Clostridiales bacterium]
MKKVPKESMFKRKGFYVALYSCLAAVMVFAVVVSFNNFAALNKPGGNTSDEIDLSGLATTTADPQTILGQAMDDALEARVKDKNAKPEDGKVGEPVKPSASAEDERASKTPEDENAAPKEPNQEQKQSANKEAPENSETPNDSDKKKTTVSESEALNAEETAEASNAADDYVLEPQFDSFSENSKMSWPVLGDIVMDYSDSHAIYDKTLDQYRTNDILCIGADIGSQVVASAEGVVVKTANTKENGNLIVIDHGNGWTTTYSQLQDGLLVKEGDLVKKGQIIGGVNNPSIYSVLLGNHLGFKVAKNSVPVNPLSVLE